MAAAWWYYVEKIAFNNIKRQPLLLPLQNPFLHTSFNIIEACGFLDILFNQHLESLADFKIKTVSSYNVFFVETSNVFSTH